MSTLPRFRRRSRVHATLQSVRRHQPRLEMLEDRLAPAAGELDPTFGAYGVITTPIGTGDDIAYATTIDAYGRIVAVGKTYSGTYSDFAIVRYNPNGTLDTSFGSGGKVITDFESYGDAAWSVVIDSLGRIVVAGESDNGFGYDFAVARYNPNGSLDTSFSGDGKVKTPVSVTSWAGDTARSIAIDGSGRLVVAGYGLDASMNWDFAVVRYNIDGSLDTTFDGDGKLMLSFGAGSDVCLELAIDSLGRIVLTGYASAGGPTNEFAVARLNPNGSLDATFDGDGKVMTDIGPAGDIGSGVVIDGSGRIIVAGYTSDGSYDDFALVRYNVDGGLDTSFDGDGIVTTAVSALRDVADAVAIDASGRIVAAGLSWDATGTGNFAAIRYNADGTLDTSFDGDGKVVTALSPGTDEATALAFDHSGRIVLVGYSHNGGNYDFGLVRYNPDGSLSSFTGGVVTTRFSAGDDSAFATAIDAYGRIVTVGKTTGGTYPDFAVARYNANGTLDSSFGSDGKVTTDFEGYWDIAYAVAIDSLGRIVVAGSEDNGFGPDFGVARYNPDGTLDTSFGGIGWVKTNISTTSWAGDIAESVVIDALGHIVVAGYSLDADSNWDFSVVRYNPDGSLDTTFDGDGKVMFAFGTGSDVCGGMAIDASGRIVLSGYAGAGGPANDFAVARLNADGSLDTTFDGDGKVMTGIGPAGDWGKEVVIDSDGRIVVCGNSINGSEDDMVLVRYNANGSLDTSFDGDGKATTDFAGFNSRGYSLALDGSGRIVVAGQASNGSNSDFAIARYNANGSLDTTFDGDGKAITAIGPGDDAAYGMTLDSSGRIIAVGSIHVSGSDYDFALVRYNSDGTLDESIHYSTGKLTTAFGTGDDSGEAMAIDGLGRIVVAGSSYNGSTYDFAVARYAPDGTLDESFGSGGRIVTPIGLTYRPFVFGLAIDGVGRIVVGGGSVIVRFNPGGGLDSTFDGDGKLAVDFWVSDLVIDSSGRIVAVGSWGYSWSSPYDDRSDFAIERFNDNGALDTSFSGDGRLVAGSSYSEDGPQVMLDSSDRIVVAGSSEFGSYGDYVEVLRLNPNGTADTSFDGDGWAFASMYGANSSSGYVSGATIDGLGRIVVAGTISEAGNPYTAVYRFNSDGAIDTSFGTSSNGRELLGYGTYSGAADVAIDGSGRIVLAGYIYLAPDYDFLVVRLNANGTLDNSFRGIGSVATHFGFGDDYATGMVIDGAGRIVVAGYAHNGSNYDFAVARYLGDNLAPTDVSLSAATVAENQSTGTLVGTLSTTDPDAGETFDYYFATGLGDTDNALFTIVGDQLLTNAVFDFESQTTYSIRVRSIDAGGMWFEEALTITVTNMNETPTDLLLSNNSLLENQPTGTLVGNMSSTDPDAGNTFTYTLVGGVGSNDNASFTIVGFQLQSNAVFDFETKNSFTIRVRTTDQGGLFTENAFDVIVTNQNEAPTDVTLTGSSVAEDQTVGTVVGSFSSTDPDVGNTFTYTLISGPGGDDNGSFTITGNQLQTAAMFNFENKNSYTIRVQTMDQGGQTYEEAFTVTVTNVNEAPVLNAISDKNVDEAGTLSFTVTATDVDAGQTLTFSLVSPPMGATIDPVTGLFNWTPDDGPANVTITVRVIDNGVPSMNDQKTFNVTVNNIAPTATLNNDGPGMPGQPVTVSFANQFDPSTADTTAGFLYSYDFNNDGDFNDSGEFFQVTQSSRSVSFPNSGTYTVHGQIADDDGDVTNVTTTVTIQANEIIVTGLDKGGAPLVTVLKATDRTPLFAPILAYAVTFKGGVRVAVGDVTGDGTPDIITAPGKGGKVTNGAFQVKVFNGATGIQVPGAVGSILPFGPTFGKGIYVAAGDVNGDGFDDIIVAPGTGMVPQVKVFSGVDGSLLYTIDAYPPNFTKGVRVAAGDINGDGNTDVITHSGSGTTSQIKVFNGLNGQPLPGVIGSVLPFEPTYKGAIFMAARDVTGDDVTDIVAVTGTGVPRVQIFDGATGFSRFVTTGLDPQYKKGIRVALGDVNGDGVADVILGTVQAKGVLANVRILDALTLGEIDSFFASDATFKGGVFVAGGR